MTPPMTNSRRSQSSTALRQMTPVRHFFVDNLTGDIAGTLAAANAPKGAPYPAGSVVQLVPTEVMVKRESGFSPATGDWEFFELDVSEKGAKIGKRGFRATHRPVNPGTLSARATTVVTPSRSTTR